MFGLAHAIAAAQVREPSDGEAVEPPPPYAVQGLDEIPDVSPYPRCRKCGDPRVGKREVCALCRSWCV